MPISQLPRDAFSQASRQVFSQLVYGEPITTDDHATVVSVSRLRGGTSSPVGIYVIRDGTAIWVPAVDANRIAQIGVATGFVAATLACIAMIRKPPWPDIVITMFKNHEASVRLDRRAAT